MTANDTKSIKYHEWIGYKQKVVTVQTKAMKFLEKLYPSRKQDELRLLASINSTKELKQLAEDLGMTKEQIKKTF